MGQGGAAPPDPTFSHKAAGDSKVLSHRKCLSSRLAKVDSRTNSLTMLVIIKDKLTDSTMGQGGVPPPDPTFSHKAAGDSKVRPSTPHDTTTVGYPHASQPSS